MYALVGDGNAKKCECKDAELVKSSTGEYFYEPWVAKFLEEGATGEELLNLECVACKLLRSSRKRVLEGDAVHEERLHEAPFDAAPCCMRTMYPAIRHYFFVLANMRASTTSRCIGASRATSHSIATTGTCQRKSLMRRGVAG